MSESEPRLVTVRWSGPLSWPGGDLESVFRSPAADGARLYFWTARVDGAERVYYVGQTEKSFAGRHLEHWRGYFSGQYSIEDPTAFARGVRRRVYKGYAHRRRGWELGAEFFDNADSLLPILLELLGTMRIWFGVFEAERRVQRRIEGAVIQALYNAGGDVAAFQEPNMRRELRRADETSIRVALGGHDFAGLPLELTA